MKRFIDLTNQITKGCCRFAFYDTIYDKFETFNDSVTWGTWDEFEENYLQGPMVCNIDRYRNLCPSWVFK